jgi:hypothetical protein
LPSEGVRSGCWNDTHSTDARILHSIIKKEFGTTNGPTVVRCRDRACGTWAQAP